MEESSFESLDYFTFTWKIHSSKMWAVFSFLTFAYWKEALSYKWSHGPWYDSQWRAFILVVIEVVIHEDVTGLIILMGRLVDSKGKSLFPGISMLWLLLSMKCVRWDWLWSICSRCGSDICLTAVGVSRLSPSRDWKISPGQELNL